MPVPLVPIQILWINLVTDGLPPLALAIGPAEPGSMLRPPQKNGQGLLSRGLGIHVLWVGMMLASLCLGVELIWLNNSNPHWQTMVFLLLGNGQLMHGLAISNEHRSSMGRAFYSNSRLLVVVAFTFLLQIAVVYHPLLNQALHTQPLRWQEWMVCFLISSLVFFVVEISKWMGERK